MEGLITVIGLFKEVEKGDKETKKDDEQLDEEGLKQNGYYDIIFLGQNWQEQSLYLH